MLFVIPIGHSSMSVRKLPWLTLAIALACIVIQLRVSRVDGEVDAALAGDSKALTDAVVREFGAKARSEDGKQAVIEAFVAGELTSPEHRLYLEYLNLRQRQRELRADGPVGEMGYRPDEHGYLRMCTSTFVHGGWLHLLGNLLFLYLVGCNLEDRWTRFGFVLLYGSGAIAAASTYAFLHPGSDVPFVGASGVISALMGAFVVVMGSSRVSMFYYAPFMEGFGRPAAGTFAMAAHFALPLWLGEQMLMASFELDGVEGTVAYGAHVGGCVFGMLVGCAMRLVGVDGKLANDHDAVAYTSRAIHEFAEQAAGNPVRAMKRYGDLLDRNPDDAEAREEISRIAASVFAHARLGGSDRPSIGL